MIETKDVARKHRKENAMKTSERRMGAGWSFAAGTLLGAVAVLALLVSLGIPRLKAEGSGRPRPVAMTSAGSAAVPETRSAPSFVGGGRIEFDGRAGEGTRPLGARSAARLTQTET